jgi:hypothetical protein
MLKNDPLLHTLEGIADAIEASFGEKGPRLLR